MASSFLPLIDNSDPRMKLAVRNKVKNVFVTQPGSTRCKKEENVQYIPVVRESPSGLLEAGVNTLQKTLVLKKQAELDEVNAQLVRKREEFKSRMEALSQRRSELELKQQQNRETMMKFGKFVAENEAKRSQALKKHEAAKEENALKQREIEELTEQLKQLKVREQVLKEKTSKYKIYEDYLLKTLDCFPSSYLDRGSKSSVMSIIRRHEALSLTNRELRNRLVQLEEEAEQVKQQLQGVKQEHDVKKLMDIKELSDLQRELETLKEENKQMEVNLLMEQGRSREKTEEVGAVLMAVNNLAEQCYLAAYGPLDKMNVLTMMDMVKEYILDKKETERRARRLMESQDAVASRAALIDKRGKGSMKSIGSKTQIKSSSNVTRKSEMAS